MNRPRSGQSRDTPLQNWWKRFIAHRHMIKQKALRRMGRRSACRSSCNHVSKNVLDGIPDIGTVMVNQRVVAVAAGDAVRGAVGPSGIQVVIPVFSEESISACAAVDEIVTDTALEYIGAGIAIEGVAPVERGVLAAIDILDAHAVIELESDACKRLPSCRIGQIEHHRAGRAGKVESV